MKMISKGTISIKKNNINTDIYLLCENYTNNNKR